MLQTISPELTVHTIRPEPSVPNPRSEPHRHLPSPQRDLIEAVMASLTSTIGPVLLPSMMPHLLRGIGRELGRRFCETQEPFQAAETASLHKQLLDCLNQLEVQWACRCQIVDQRMDRLELAISDCPLEQETDSPLHLCWLYSAILGEIAGRRFAYAKASVLPRTELFSISGTSDTCRITLYLQKTADSVAAEGVTYPQASQTLDQFPPRTRTGLPLDRLSDREWQVLRLIGEGFSDKQIAAALKMSVRTAENHASKIYAKLGVHGRPRLIRYALQHRVVSI
ncbi:MAG: response regulator transcription factor [Nitrospiraceae bacterium]